MPTVLAVDPGSRYIGVAVSNPERTLAFPVTVLDATPKHALLTELATIARERTVDQLVVGRPLSLRGSPLPMTAVAEELAATLGKHLELPVALVDERLSTKEAAVTGKPGHRVDAQAAALFLQTYLDSRG